LRKVSKNPEGVARVRGRSIIGLQILIELLMIINIDIADVGTVGAVRMKISRITRISKGGK